MNKVLNKLKYLININNIDGYIVPKHDEFFSEYAFPNRLKTISNFTGSAGFAIILKNKNYLFVDGRYTTQAKIQSGNNFEIIEIPNFFPFQVLKNKNKKFNIGFDPKVFTYAILKKYFKNICNLFPIENNLIDEIFLEKKKNSNNTFFALSSKITGETIGSKLNRLTNILKKSKIDNLFISAPENVAWLLNIRGSDNPNSPIPNSRIIVTKNKKIYLFTNLNNVKKIKNLNLYKNINYYDYNNFVNVLIKLNGNSFCIDKITCSIFFESLIKSKYKIKKHDDPCYILKSIKNNLEINNMKKAHIEDGVALTKFLYWIKNHNLKNLNEINVEKKLENFRKKNKNYLYPSFSTIAGSGPNGAIIHYRANKISNRKINKNDIFLCDSGGQYKYGTTDVTRTICFKEPSLKIKNIFTRVLKGHIAVYNTDLNKTNKGYQIDKRARYWLKQINLDYGHGTGHGVGFFLNVHEGPQSISKFSKVPLNEGMIVSNEPGYYKENKFGIRIENLIYVSSGKKGLEFKNLTFAPIDLDLINKKLLSKKEKDYLYKYHLEIYYKICKYLTSKEKKWMLSLI